MIDPQLSLPSIIPSIKPIIRATITTIYLIGVVVLGFYAIKDIQARNTKIDFATDQLISRDCLIYTNPSVPPEDKFGSPLPLCIEQIVVRDGRSTSYYPELIDLYRQKAVRAVQTGNIVEGVSAVIKVVQYNFQWKVVTSSPLALWSIWALVGAYFLLYDRVPDLIERALEGAVSGAIVSWLMYFAPSIFTHKVREDFDGWSAIETYISVPPATTYGLIVFFIIWFGIDFWKKQVDNLYAKIVLFIVGFVTFLVAPAPTTTKYWAIPVFTLVLGIGYHYWRCIPDRRRQVGVLVYLIVAIGLVAAFVKHRFVFVGARFASEYSWPDLAEMVLDFIVFILGALLTYLELHRKPEVPFPDSPRPVPNENAETGKKKDNSLSPFAIFGVISAIIGFVYLLQLHRHRKD